MVEDGENDGSFSYPSRTDESDGFQVFGNSDELSNELPAPKTSPWRRGRRFSKRNTIQP